MINRVKQTANNYGEQSSDPSKAVICKDQQSSQLQIWHLMLTHKHMARQAPVAMQQIINRLLHTLTGD